MPETSSRFALVEGAAQVGRSFAEDVARGLRDDPRWLPSHWFYDERGSKLFEQICDLPEYYLTRAERSILEENADEIVAGFDRTVTLVELGSGSAVKTRPLIEALIARQGELVFAPIDVSRTMLEESAEGLLASYPELEVQAFAGVYEEGLAHLARDHACAHLNLWLGSSVGNLHREDASEFLAGMCAEMVETDRLLLGVDLRKDRERIEAAYDDAAGVTARFDLNLLARINRELEGEFDLAAFRHRARYDETEGRVESHLESLRDQSVTIAALDLELEFEAGETIHTENSYKYSQAEIDALAAGSGLQRTHEWRDGDGLFSLNLLAPA